MAWGGGGIRSTTWSGFHLGFLSRGGGANATIPELGGGGKDYSMFSIREERRCAH